MASKSSTKTSDKTANKSATKTATKASAKTADKTANKASAKTADKTTNKATTKASDKTATKESDNSSNNQVIFPHEDGWGVRKEGSDNTTAIYETRVEALERAREIAENQGGEVYIIYTGEETA